MKKNENEDEEEIKENEPEKREKKENLEELTKKMNKLMNEVQSLKNEVAKESTSPTKPTPPIESTIEQSMKIIEELPRHIGKSLEEFGVFKDIFYPHLTEDERKEKIEEQKEKIEERAENMKNKTKKLAKNIKKEVGREIQKELKKEGLIDSEIEKERDIPQKLEDRTDTLQQAIDEIVKKIVSKSKKELKANIEEASKTFDTGSLANLLSTLASPERLEILKFLHGDGQYYTDIGEKVDLGPSSLKFHLGKLKDTDLINQERSRGKYFITEKGKSALRLTAFLGMILLPSEFKSESNEELP